MQKPGRLDEQILHTDRVCFLQALRLRDWIFFFYNNNLASVQTAKAYPCQRFISAHNKRPRQISGSHHYKNIVLLSSSLIQTILSALEFHQIIRKTFRSRAIPPVGNFTPPRRISHCSEILISFTVFVNVFLLILTQSHFLSFRNSQPDPRHLRSVLLYLQLLIFHQKNHLHLQ